MKLHFLGGGDEVGASMLYVETSLANIVVDCGIRMGGGASSSPPDLAPLDGQRVDAIFATHAHLDHTGALPLLHAAFPKVPVYCTPPTRELMRVLLLDAIKIMDEKLDREGELPLYPVEAVESLLARIETVPFGGSMKIGESGRLRARLLPAGHILGAAMLQVTGPETSLLVTGDISQADQYTVPGLAIPKQGSRVVVAESTYGGKLHSDRGNEEKRFVAKVREVLGRGGKLIVPAFALGRAQELLLILVRAMRKGELEPVPVYADGLVKRICGIYGNYANYMPPFARKLAVKNGNPFFGVLDNVRQVTDGRHREEVIAGPPCVVIASSGMLTGGASVAYAQRLAGDEANCIAITGYQDEESPGRRLMELAAGEADSIFINKQAVPVKCEVAKYALSAHIDGYSLLQFAARMKPEHVLWVHGDGGAREWLHERCESATSHLVTNGQTVELRTGGAAIRHTRHAMGLGIPLDPSKVPLLAEALRREGHQGRACPPSLLLDRWYGEANWGVSEEDEMRELLAASSHFEAVERGGRTCYLLQSAATSLALSAQRLGPALPNVVAAETERLFPPDTGLYKARQYHEERRVALSFNFPKKAKRDFQDRVAELAQSTGWTVEVYPQPNQGVLLDVARGVLAPLGPLTRVGYRSDLGSVSAKLAAPPDPEQWEELTVRFLAETGCGLTFEVKGPGNVPSKIRHSGAIDEGQAHRMEINSAFGRIESALGGAGVGFFKKSKKDSHEGVYIELRFVTPAVGARHARLLDELARETGWSIAVSPNITVNELQRLAVECLPAGAEAVGAPKVHAGEREVRVVCRALPSHADMISAAELFLEQTGFTLQCSQNSR